MARSSAGAKRQRGNIERRVGGFRVRVSAGKDPTTGERLMLTETVPIAPPGDRKRQVHAIISGAVSAAVRWNWIPHNPASAVRLPAKRRPQPKPPTADQMARIIEPAYEEFHERGVYLWLSAVTGARQGEVVGSQWVYVRGPGGMLLMDTKTQQGRHHDPAVLRGMGRCVRRGGGSHHRQQDAETDAP